MKSYKLYKQSPGQCGPASLRAQIYYWKGREVREGDVVKLANSSIRNGCDWKGLVRAAKKYGLEAIHISKSGSIGLLGKLVSQGVYPLVCYTDRYYGEDHWANVLSLDGGVILADSALGVERYFKPEEFYTDWSIKKKKVVLNNTLVIFPSNPIWKKKLSWLNKIK